MSEEHTQGYLAARDEWLVPESQLLRPIGASSDKVKDRDHYANVVTTVKSKYHDDIANARRLAACWNALEGIDTKAIETLAAKGGVLDLARKAEKAALHLAAALHENAMLRETIERLKP